jgi:hypothetical protein
MFVKSDRMEEAFHKVRDELEEGIDEDFEVPENLGAQVKKLLKKYPPSRGIARSSWSSIPTRRWRLRTRGMTTTRTRI